MNWISKIFHKELGSAEHISYYETRIPRPSNLKHPRHQVVLAKIRIWKQLHAMESGKNCDRRAWIAVSNTYPWQQETAGPAKLKKSILDGRENA